MIKHVGFVLFFTLTLSVRTDAEGLESKTPEPPSSENVHVWSSPVFLFDELSEEERAAVEAGVSVLARSGWSGRGMGASEIVCSVRADVWPRVEKLLEEHFTSFKKYSAEKYRVMIQKERIHNLKKDGVENPVDALVAQLENIRLPGPPEAFAEWWSPEEEDIGFYISANYHGGADPEKRGIYDHWLHILGSKESDGQIMMFVRFSHD